MTDSDLRADLALAVEAAVAGGEIAMRYFGEDPEVTLKAPGQPVTEADLKIDREIRSRLIGARGDYGWLSEETVDDPARLSRERVWIVDPIDGTNSFIEARPEFVVSIGLAVKGRAAVGVLHNPATGETYSGIRGGGSRLGDRTIRVALPPRAGDERVLIGSRTELGLGQLDEYRDGWTILPLGSTAYRMAKVAEGVGHLYASGGTKMEWDVCAAAVIVEEAGGTVSDGSGAPLGFNRASPSFGGMVASCGDMGEG